MDCAQWPKTVLNCKWSHGYQLVVNEIKNGSENHR